MLGPAGRRVAVACLAVLLVVLALVSFTVGTYSMTAEQLLSTIRAFFTGSIADAETSRSVAVLFSIRIPRVLLACTVGAALAVSGAAYQGIFRNPMVSPDILGVSNAASVGVALGLLWGFPTVVVHAMSFAFGIGAVALVLLVSHVATRRSADAQNVPIMASVLAVGSATLLALRWRLNALSFGDEEARSLGVDVRRCRLLVIGASTLMTAVSVCFCGVIGWVGLVIPHIVRLATGPDYRSLIPVCLLTGACFMLAVDDMARVLVPGELPVGVLTALVGAPLFVYMLARNQRRAY